MRYLLSLSSTESQARRFRLKYGGQTTHLLRGREWEVVELRRKCRGLLYIRRLQVPLDAPGHTIREAQERRDSAVRRGVPVPAPAGAVALRDVRTRALAAREPAAALLALHVRTARLKDGLLAGLQCGKRRDGLGRGRRGRGRRGVVVGVHGGRRGVGASGSGGVGGTGAAHELTERVGDAVDEEDRGASDGGNGGTRDNVIRDGRRIVRNPEGDGAVGSRGHVALCERQVDGRVRAADDDVAEEVLSNNISK